MDRFAPLHSPPPSSVRVGDAEIGPGTRVRLSPRPDGDVMDRALAGRYAVVEGIDQDEAGRVHVAVTLEDDPGRDLGEARTPAHRFYFAPEEVEPAPPAPDVPARRILVAGVGNVFLGDDGFGVEVVRRLAARSLGPGVEVVDFGIRGMDLVYALQRDYHAVILVDAAPRGGRPGALYVVEPPLDGEGGAALHAHGMDPVRALRLAHTLGARLDPARLRIVACEPGHVPDPDADPEAMTMELSDPVRAALEGASDLVESVVRELAALPPPRAAPAETPQARREGR